MKITRRYAVLLCGALLASAPGRGARAADNLIPNPSFQTQRALTGPAVKVLFDFGAGKAAPWDGGKIVKTATGALAYQVENGFGVCDQPQDWTGYDQLKIDVWNPDDTPKALSIEIRDAQTRDYWTRVNYATVAAPGPSTITIPTTIYVGEKSRPGRPLLQSQIRRVVLAPEEKKGALLFINIRLERLSTAGVVFPELHAFDFGLPNSPVMPGYTPVTTGAIYTAGRGFGWQNTGWARGFDAFGPDALFQDFIVMDDAKFRVDLPDGKYHVIMNLDCPGGFWGEVQQYSHRQVTVNGQVRLDQTMNRAEFTKFYFRNAHQEDLPGLDTFGCYVEPTFHIQQFDVDVTGGRMVLGFTSDGRWGISLSALVIYPAGQAQAGRKFWDWTTRQRQAQFNDYFKQVAPKPAGAPAPAEGYVLFTRGLDLAGAADGPHAQETIPATGLAYQMAGDEEQPLVLALQPGTDLGTIDLKLSPFSGPGGAVLDPRTFQPGWIDYRITRVTAEGSVYTVAPRYWHPTPAPAGKVTRNFWIRTKVARGTAPGRYTGKLTIQPQHGPNRDIPVALTVLPWALDPVDIAAGPFGCSLYLPWAEGDPATREWNQVLFDKVLTALHENGFTTLTGLPHIGMQAAGGKVLLDFAQADNEMKALRAHGFDRMISSYGASLGYNMYGDGNGLDTAFARKAGFADCESFFHELYGQIEQHATANHWLPIAWNLCDEPLGEAAVASARNAALHDKVARALNLKLQTFTGATSMEGADPGNTHYGLVTALSMPALNGHDAASIKLLQEKGHKFSFYNDGNRWTYGRYMKALAVNQGLTYRVTWHLNAIAGNPYYALDCREDDYCFYNTDENQVLVPSLTLLGQILPGLNDYRYLTTLQRLLQEKANSPAAAAARQVYQEQVNLVPGKDRKAPGAEVFARDRAAVTQAIRMLVEH